MTYYHNILQLYNTPLTYDSPGPLRFISRSLSVHYFETLQEVLQELKSTQITGNKGSQLESDTLSMSAYIDEDLLPDQKGLKSPAWAN